MQIQSAEFATSNSDFQQCPPPNQPEVAFIGRSNVGKSSLLNMITGRRGLAKTSTLPGKTQLINHFIINRDWYLVDLPGYGFAQNSKGNQAKWRRMTRDYLQNRENLMCTLVLIDSQLELQKIDLEFMQWLGSEDLAFAIVFTKSDKLSPAGLEKSIHLYKAELARLWETLPPVFVTSADTYLGKEELLAFIDTKLLEF